LRDDHNYKLVKIKELTPQLRDDHNYKLVKIKEIR